VLENKQIQCLFLNMVFIYHHSYQPSLMKRNRLIPKSKKRAAGNTADTLEIHKTPSIYFKSISLSLQNRQKGNFNMPFYNWPSTCSSSLAHKHLPRKAFI